VIPNASGGLQVGLDVEPTVSTHLKWGKCKNNPYIYVAE
jgi:hypothetical protein